MIIVTKMVLSNLFQNPQGQGAMVLVETNRKKMNMLNCHTDLCDSSLLRQNKFRHNFEYTKKSLNTNQVTVLISYPTPHSETRNRATKFLSFKCLSTNVVYKSFAQTYQLPHLDVLPTKVVCKTLTT